MKKVSLVKEDVIVRFQVADIFRNISKILEISLIEIPIADEEFNLYKINPDFKKYKSTDNNVLDNFILFIDNSDPVFAYYKGFYTNFAGIDFFVEGSNEFQLIQDLNDMKQMSKLKVVSDILVQENVNITCIDKEILLEKNDKISIIK